MLYGSISCNAVFLSCIYVDLELEGQEKLKGRDFLSKTFFLGLTHFLSLSQTFTK